MEMQTEPALVVNPASIVANVAAQAAVNKACETCGNEIAKPMRIELDGVTHVYDTFECAVHAIAPRCRHCGIRIMGHGVETSEAIFCCTHCQGAFLTDVQAAS